MMNTILSKWKSLIIVPIILVISLIIFYSLTQKNQQQVQPGLGLPIRLTIPIINVDSSIEYVGLTEGGAMDIPQSPINVGWFNLGPRPGEVGSAVIDGHYGWRNKEVSAFDNLYKLKIGDKIYVENDMGDTFTFVVREIRNYDPEADTSEIFISNDGKSHLNLITCEGIWNESAQTYAQRLVVFADIEE